MKFDVTVNLLLYTVPNIGNIDRVKNVLLDKGLIYAKKNHRIKDSPIDENILVWLDSEDIGRYRVHLYSDKIYKNEKYDIIDFCYWLNTDRIKKEVLEIDPMKEAINKSFNVIKGNYKIMLKQDENPEEIVRKVFSH